MSKLVVALTERSMWLVKYDGGGSVPNSLKGLFTSEGYALAAIDTYKKGKANKVPDAKIKKKYVADKTEAVAA